MSQITKIRRKKHEKQVNFYVNFYEFSLKEFAYWSRTRMEWTDGDEGKKWNWVWWIYSSLAITKLVLVSCLGNQVISRKPWLFHTGKISFISSSNHGDVVYLIAEGLGLGIHLSHHIFMKALRVLQYIFLHILLYHIPALFHPVHNFQRISLLCNDILGLYSNAAFLKLLGWEKKHLCFINSLLEWLWIKKLNLWSVLGKRIAKVRGAQLNNKYQPRWPLGG